MFFSQPKIANHHPFSDLLSGWFGSSELKSFDAVSAEKTKSSLKRGSGLRTALSEALDPSLITHRTSTELDLDEYNEDQDDHKQAGSAKKKAPPKVKKSTPKNDSAAEKRRRPSTTEDQPVSRKMVKTTDSQLSDEEDISKVLCQNEINASRREKAHSL